MEKAEGRPKPEEEDDNKAPKQAVYSQAPLLPSVVPVLRVSEREGVGG